MSLPFVELNREQEENSFFHFWHKVSLSPMYLLHSLIHRSRCHRLLLLFYIEKSQKRINEKKKFTKIVLLFLLDAIRSYGSHTHHQCRHYWRQSFRWWQFSTFYLHCFFLFVGQIFLKASNFLHEKFLLLRLLTFSFQFTRWGKFVVQALFLFIVIQPSKTSLIFCWQRWWKIM